MENSNCIVYREIDILFLIVNLWEEESKVQVYPI